jgi:DNA repair exonuclease SbcCD nuclease subunit
LSKPIAVLISDVHYNLQTLPLADAAMRQAISKANELDIPLIVAGDLHDTKANMRAECVNAMIETFNMCRTKCYIIRGNHDALNEKSEAHSIGFLNRLGEVEDLDKSNWDNYVSEPAVVVVDQPNFFNDLGAFNGNSVHLIPYHHDVSQLRKYLSTVDKGSTIIMHQGIQGSNSGEYIQDKSAITKEDVADFRVISGHYHARQDIKTGRPQKGAVGLFSYVGNPYTLNFGEASDPEKGFQILMNDGSLEFVPTDLRRHCSFTCDTLFLNDTRKATLPGLKAEDLLWVKVLGSKEELLTVTKTKIANKLQLTQDFRLDLIPTDTETQSPADTKQLTSGELLDKLIDSLSNTTDERKTRLKELWRKSV